MDGAWQDHEHGGLWRTDAAPAPVRHPWRVARSQLVALGRFLGPVAVRSLAALMGSVLSAIVVRALLG
jgi:hypothetical protein